MNLPTGHTPDPAGCVSGALFRVMKALVFRHDPPPSLVDLPLAQFRCVHVVAEHEGERMQELSHRLELKLPAVSQIVDRLVRRGLIVRRQDPGDRRVVRLSLSDSVREEMDAWNAARSRRMKEAIAGLKEADVEAVVAALNLLADAAERAQARESQPEDEISPDSDPLVELIAHRERTRRQMTAADVSPEPVQAGQS